MRLIYRLTRTLEDLRVWHPSVKQAHAENRHRGSRCCPVTTPGNDVQRRNPANNRLKPYTEPSQRWACGPWHAPAHCSHAVLLGTWEQYKRHTTPMLSARQALHSASSGPFECRDMFFD